MPARGQRKTDGARPARRAAMLYLDNRGDVAALAARFDLKPDSIHQAVHRLRNERGIERPLRGLQPSPHSLEHELGARARQDGWLTCCQSATRHRFDCTVHPGGKAYLPVAPPSTRQLDRIRIEPRSAPCGCTPDQIHSKHHRHQNAYELSASAQPGSEP